MNWREYIESTPDVLWGKPQIKGTRILVSFIFGYFAAGNTIEKIIQEFPDLNRERISACLDFARDLSDSHYNGIFVFPVRNLPEIIPQLMQRLLKYLTVNTDMDVNYVMKVWFLWVKAN